MSYWGMAGGLWAIATFGQAAVKVLVDPGDGSRWPAVLYAGFGLAFVPAFVYSILPSPRRELVLRVETALCLGLGFFGLFVLGDYGFPLVLSVPTIMLATAAGLVFTGRRSKTG